MSLTESGIKSYLHDRISLAKYFIENPEKCIEEELDDHIQRYIMMRGLLYDEHIQPLADRFNMAIPDHMHVVVDDAIIRNILCRMSNFPDSTNVDIYLMLGKYWRCTFNKFVETIKSHNKIANMTHGRFNECLDQHPDESWIKSPDTAPRFRYHITAYTKDDNPNPSMYLRFLHTFDADKIPSDNREIIIYSIDGIDHNIQSKYKHLSIHFRQLVDCKCMKN